MLRHLNPKTKVMEEQRRSCPLDQPSKTSTRAPKAKSSWCALAGLSELFIRY
jgi:hypothetical protein